MLDYSVLHSIFNSLYTCMVFILDNTIFTSSQWSSVGFTFGFSIIIPNFWTVWTKYYLKILTTFWSSSIRLSFSTKFRILLSFSTKFRILWDFTLFEERGFTVYQRFLFSVTEDISILAKWSFLAFSKWLSRPYHFKYF